LDAIFASHSIKNFLVGKFPLTLHESFAIFFFGKFREAIQLPEKLTGAREMKQLQPTAQNELVGLHGDPEIFLQTLRAETGKTFAAGGAFKDVTRIYVVREGEGTARAALNGQLLRVSVPPNHPSLSKALVHALANGGFIHRRRGD
jgi:hypothetical protein